MARKPGLGKGLGALIPDGGGVTDPDNNSPLRRVPVDSIRPNKYQPRRYFDEDSLSTLAASIKEMGVLQPIIVRVNPEEEGTYELIAGERRWRASQLAAMESIPVLVSEHVDNLLSLEQAVVENLHREDLHPLEEAAAYQQLIDEFSLTHDQIAKRVGKGRTYITNTLRLLSLGESGQLALGSGKITAGHARALLALADPEAQTKMVQRIISSELSVRDTEAAIRTLLQPKETKPSTASSSPTPAKPTLRPVPDPAVAEIENLFEAYLDTRVHVDLRDAKTGRIIIEFADLDDLERIYKAVAKRALH
jgi:ParB family transcriptional regulator, chromosome partitioning protein